MPIIDNTESTSSSATFNKQEIFYQIDQELMSEKPRNTGIVQRTRSNYSFVILVDMIALICAVVGIYVVYDLFREQQVRLVSGRQGVRVLESTLLEEINKQYVLDLAKKEAELQEVSLKLEKLEIEYADSISRIRAEAQQELERQKILLDEKIASQSGNMSEAEKAQLQEQYNQQLLELEQKIQQEENQRVAQLEKEKQERIEAEKQESEDAAALQLQIQQVQQQLQASEAELVQAREEAEEESEQYVSVDFQAFDNSIAEAFKLVQNDMKRSNYSKIQTHLDFIKERYANAGDRVLVERKNADLFAVSVIEEYLVAKNALSKQDNSFSLTRAKIQQYQSLFSRNQNKQITREIKALNRDMPEFMNFAENYMLHIRQGGAPSIDALIAKGDNFVYNKKFKDAADVYQQTLKIYSLDKKAESVVQKLYDAIILDLKDRGIITEEDIIPTKIQGEVQKILEDTRHNVIDKQIVYMQEPDGYVADVVDNNTVLVLLLAQNRVKRKQQIEVFRLQSNYELEKVGNLISDKAQKDMFPITSTNHKMKIGDLIYIKEK